MLNSRNFRVGIRLVGNGTLTGSVLGDLQAYTVDGKLYYNNGVTNSAILTEDSSSIIVNKKLDDSTVFFVDTADNTKEFHVDAVGTTGTKTTLTSSQTANRIIILPDASDTLVGKATTDTLTNKSIDGSTNAITNVSLTTGVTGILPIANGGTNASTKAGAFDSLSPMTTGGDLIYGGASGTGTRLPNGAAGQVLTSAGTTLAPTWSTPSPGFVNPMTSVGDIIVGGVSGTATRLGAGTNGFILTLSGGTPVWASNAGGSAVQTVGTIDSQSKSANGLVISGTSLVAQTADSSFPGMVSIGTQSFAGSKTFTSAVTTPIVNTTAINDRGSGLTFSTSSNQDINISPNGTGRIELNKVIDLTQITTPSNPASGKNSAYFKSDDNLYLLNSSGIETMVGASVPVNSELRVTVSAGSVPNTYISTWANVERNIGTAITYTKDAVNGDTFTINEDGIYAINYTNSYSASASYIGITLNESQLTTQIYNVTPANVLSMVYTVGAFAAGPLNESCGVTVHLVAGDVLRAHNDINCNSSYGSFHITKVAVQTVDPGAKAEIWTADANGYGSINTFTKRWSNVVNAVGNAVTYTDSSTLGSSFTINQDGMYSFSLTEQTNSNSQFGVTINQAIPTQAISQIATDNQVLACGYTNGNNLFATVSGTKYLRAGDVLRTVSDAATNGINPQLTSFRITKLSNSGIAASGGAFYASPQAVTQSSNITGTSFSTFSTSPTLTFTPTITGTYKVYAGVPLLQGTTAVVGNSRIFNSSGGAALLYESYGATFGGTSTTETSTFTQSVYTLTQGVAYSFDVQGRNSSTGSLSLDAADTPFYIFAELDTAGTASSSGSGISMTGSNWAIDPQITVANSGTITSSSIFSRRVGDSLEINGRVTLGTVTGSPMSINLGSYAIDSTKLGSAATGTPVGNMQRTNSGTSQAHPSTSYGTWDLFYDGSTVSNVYVGATHSSQAYDKVPSNGIFSNNDNCTFRLTIPINGWTASNGSTPGQTGATLFASSLISTTSTAITGTSFATFSNSPTFSFTPTITGTYKIYANAVLDQQTPSVAAAGRIFNTIGSAALLYESEGSSFGRLENSFLQSVYTLNAGVTYAFEIQGKNASTGSLFLDGTDSPFYMFAELSTNGAGIGGGGGGVSTLNSLTGAVNIVAGTGITVTPAGSNITIAASGSLTNPMTTGGDIIYGAASGVPTRLGNGSSGQVLTSSGGTSAPTWSTPSGGLSGLTTDGVVYATSSTTVASTSAGTAGQVLTSNGAGVAPTYQAASGGGFDFFASSQVTTNSSSFTGTSYTTASNSPTFVFTPNFSGTYKVYGSIPMEAQGLGNVLCKITNTVGSATLLNTQEAGVFNPTGGNLISSVPTQSVYTLVSGTPYTFVLQVKILTGGAGGIVAGNAGSGNNFNLFAERIG